MKRFLPLFYVLFFPVLFMIFPALISISVSVNHTKTPDIQYLPETKEIMTVIRVLDAETNKIFSISLEDYLPGVLAAEMPASYETEALKAQAVAARSFIISKLFSKNPDHPDADVCTDPNHCKAYLDEKTYIKKWKENERETYRKKISEAVSSTSGEYMIYGDEVVEAFFFAGCGGRTESAEDVWGGARPYLKSVVSEGDIYSPHFKSEKVVSAKDFYSALNIQNTGAPPRIAERTQGGSVRTLLAGGHTFSGKEIRKIFGLKSSNFTISLEADKIIFTVLGHGHGVGMSQFGANYMAKNGKNYTEILSHYYTNIQIIKN